MKRFFGLAKFGMLAAPVAIGLAMLVAPGQLGGLLLAFLIAAPLGVAGFFVMSFHDRASARAEPLVAGGWSADPSGDAPEELASAADGGLHNRDAYIVPTKHRRFTDPEVAAVGMYGGYTATGEYVEPW